jgi:hypothetical protein
MWIRFEAIKQKERVVVESTSPLVGDQIESSGLSNHVGVLIVEIYWTV